MICPKAIVILSGKRKCGKDYFADLLSNKLGCENCDLVRLSAPLKKKYAEIHNLEYKRLLDSSSYKEAYRDDMIKWGESEREKNPEIFCHLASEACKTDTWIVTDARRPTDIEYFRSHFPKKTLLIRIHSSDKTRRDRGWVFKMGVDDAPSECALDTGIMWDIVIDNTIDISSDDLDKVCDRLEQISHK